MTDIIKTTVDWLAAGHKVALATVISTFGSSPRPVGSQLAVNETESFEGSVSGGCIEPTIITEALHALGGGRHRLVSLGVTHDAARDIGLACGGSMDIFIEPVAPHRRLLQQLLESIDARQNACLLTDLESGAKTLITGKAGMQDVPAELQPVIARVLARGQSERARIAGSDYFLHGFAPDPKLIIVGAVHIAKPLVQMARLIGYEPFIIDPRRAFATRGRFPDATLVTCWPETAFDQIGIHSNTAVVVLGHWPSLDDPALAQALRSDAFYIGALGSQKTHAARMDRLARAGFESHALQRIHGPIGIFIGSITPEEIALSIMAEITRAKRLPREG